MVDIYFLWVCAVEQVVEVVFGAFYQIGVFEVFENRGHEFDGFVGMGVTKIGVVVDNGFAVFGVFDEFA